MRVCINLSPEQVTRTTGIGQVVLAQWKHLPQFGIELTSDEQNADVYATHIQKPTKWPRIDVTMTHGLYWQDIEHLPYARWHHEANRGIISSARESLAVTVPSNWVAYPFKRDMRLSPIVIPHGIDFGEFMPGNNRGYILYNKNRESDVCTSKWAWNLASSGQHVISTFYPPGLPIPSSMSVTGLVDFEEMKRLLSEADIYLATTLETFGVGTLEAMACGVPVLGFNWGGTKDIITHKVNGYLVDPEDVKGLNEGIDYIRRNRKEMGAAARETAARYNWPVIIQGYAKLFEAVGKYKPANNTAIIITNYNYGQWVNQAIESAANQSMKPDEIVVVDDGSTDNSQSVIEGMRGLVETKGIKFKPIFQKNSGVASARNRGLMETGAEFVTCLDADDWIDPNFIATLKPALAADRSLGIAYSGLLLVNPQGVNGFRTGWPPEFDWDTQSTPNVPPFNCIPSGCMFRRTMWLRAGGYRQEYAPGEDTEFWVRGLAVGYNAKRVVDDPLFIYRAHDGSASRTKKYVPIDDKMPWMRTKEYPFAAPTKRTPQVRSYALPGITVIIPVGPGHESYVTQALDSLIGQTYWNWEVIVVNDTGTKLRLPPAYPFVRLIDNPGKHGAGVARNVGIKAAEAPTILFLDADDLLAPTALEKMMAAFVKEKGERYIYSDWVAVEKDGTHIGHAKDPDRTEWHLYHPVTVLMARDCAMKMLFDETLDSWEDWEFFLRAAVAGVCGMRVPEPLLIYRLESGQRRMQIITPDGQPNELGAQVLKELEKRYAKYFNGGAPMAGCASCGGSSAAQTILRAKGVITRTSGEAPPVSAKEIPMNPTTNIVRLEYIGERVGATSYTVNGRTYRAGNNPFEKYIDVQPEDAPTLERLGCFKIVSQPAPPPPPVPGPRIPAAGEVALPGTPQEVTSEDIAKMLLQAQADFEKEEAVKEKAEAEAPPPEPAAAPEETPPETEPRQKGPRRK